MTSHVDYIADQGIEQLNHLIEVATKRRDDLRHGGWVRVWVVADYANKGWFAKGNYAGAVAYLTKLANKHMAAGKTYELSLEETQYRPAEAQQLIEETQAEIAKGGA